MLVYHITSPLNTLHFVVIMGASVIKFKAVVKTFAVWSKHTHAVWEFRPQMHVSGKLLRRQEGKK